MQGKVRVVSRVVSCLSLRGTCVGWRRRVRFRAGCFCVSCPRLRYMSTYLLLTYLQRTFTHHGQTRTGTDVAQAHCVRCYAIDYILRENAALVSTRFAHSNVRAISITIVNAQSSIVRTLSSRVGRTMGRTYNSIPTPGPSHGRFLCEGGAWWGAPE